MALLNKTEKMRRLLDRYFEGETTEKEEAVLRKYFLSGKVDASLTRYQEMFAAVSMENAVGVSFRSKRGLEWSTPISAAASAAACLAVLVIKS